MADEKRIATLEWLHNNLYEFKKTEELRNSKKGATKSELTRLYNVDESLLTSYTDKQLIPQGKCVGVSLLKFLGVHGVNHSCNIDFVKGKYQIISSNSFSQTSTYYSFPPKEEIGNAFLIKTDGGVEDNIFISATPILGDCKEYEELLGGRKKIKTFSNVIHTLDENYTSIKETQGGDFTISPNRRYVLENRPCTLYDDVTTTNESFNYPIELGYVFDNKRVYTTLSYKQNYPEETFTNTTYCILSNQNSYLVLEQEGEKIRLSKISEDLTYIPNNVYSDFVKDCTENTNQLSTKFSSVHPCRTFIRDIPPFDFTDKEFIGLFAKKDLGGNEDGTLNSRVFIRFGENDLTHNYIEYETYVNNISGGTYSDIWSEERFNGADVINAITQRDSEDFDIEERFNYPTIDPDKNIYVKGVINISNIKKVMIGVRNRSGLSNRELLLWTKSPKIFKDGVEQFEIDISRKNVSVYNYNIYPFIISNEEGVEIVYPEQYGTNKDVLSEIMFKQEKIFEETIPSLKKATLITHRSNTDESFVRIELNNGTIQTRRTSNINNIINQGGDIVLSTIKSPTENLLIYKQPTSDVTNITINGEERKMIGIVQNV